MEIFGKRHRQDKQHTFGTHRTRSPEETLRHYMPLMERLGITRLANVTGLDFVGIPVYMAVRPTSRTLAVSQGKGVDEASAKASALMESIEGWHAERIELPLRYESYHALRRAERVLEVEELPLAEGGSFDPNRPLLWCRGHDLVQEEALWLPFDCVSLSSVRPSSGRATFFRSTNGLASGNHLLEATVHALCEVIERDASALWFSDPVDPAGKQTQVEPRTVDDPLCRTVLDRLDAANLLVGIYDVTSDLEVPAYHCVIFEHPGTPRAMGYFWGFGCHLAPEIALARALTEAVQVRLTEIAGSREDILAESYEIGRDDDELEEMKALVSVPPPPLAFRSRPSLATGSFEDDVATLRARLRAVGLQRAVVVELTKPEIGIPVVKVVVPGLESIYSAPGYRPGPGARAVLARGAA